MKDWRQIQKKSFTNVEAAADFLMLDAEKRKLLLLQPPFPFLLPIRLAEKIEKNSLVDPLARQFLPLKEEANSHENFIADPVHDAIFQKTPKMLHKYQGRSLIVTSGACAMNCRFCFRQNFHYQSAEKGFEKEIAYVKETPDLHEVILSGGDPLSMSDATLEKLLYALFSIDHVKLIRFHTRFPMGIPERISDDLLAIFRKTTKQIVFIIHSNHAKEFDIDVLSSLKKIQQLGIPLLCQSVLLKGVNDTLTSLRELCMTLVTNGIRPYYLNQLDRVKGAAHFEVPKEVGIKILAALKLELPGYAIPTYVEDIGQPSKTHIT